MGDFPSALRNATKALTIRESLEGKQTARTVTIYALLGRVNALNGNLSSGRQLAELAVAIARRTVYAVSDLGEVLYLAKD